MTRADKWCPNGCGHKVICQRWVRYKSELSTKALRNVKDKPYQCLECNARFKADELFEYNPAMESHAKKNRVR